MNIQIPTPAVAVTGVSVQPAVSVVQPAVTYVQPAVPLIQPTVTVVQPAAPLVQPVVVMSQRPVAAVPDYLGYSIFTMLCCCLPLGIVAIIYSCNTRDANLTGQRELAMGHSRVAFILNNVALGIGLAIITVVIILSIKLGH